MLIEPKATPRLTRLLDQPEVRATRGRLSVIGMAGSSKRIPSLSYAEAIEPALTLLDPGVC